MAPDHAADLSPPLAAPCPRCGSLRRRSLFYLLLLLLWFPFFFVFSWMIEGAFKTQMQNTAIPPLFIFKPTLARTSSPCSSATRCGAFCSTARWSAWARRCWR